MNEETMSEDAIQAAYQGISHALVASEESQAAIEQAISRRRRVRAMAAVGGTALAMVGAVALGSLVTGRGVESLHQTPPAASTDRHPSADEKSSLPDVSGLTGKDVGLALGLTPDEAGDDGVYDDCSATFAEYKDNGTGAAGFCLAGVTDDPVLETTFALQITGLLPTDVVKAYAAALVELRNSHAEGAARFELMRKVSDLAAQVEAQGHAR